MELRNIFKINKSNQNLEELSRDELRDLTETSNKKMAFSATAFILTSAVAVQDFNAVVQLASASGAVTSGINTLKKAWDSHKLMSQSARLRIQDRLMESRRESRSNSLGSNGLGS